MVSLEKFIIPANYVLVKPDPHLETYQMKGKELGLLSADFKYENGERVSIKERNASVFGTVFAVPERLNFNLGRIMSLADANTLWRFENDEKIPVNIAIHRELSELAKTSVLFDVDVELRKGDRVNFSYQAHKVAKEEKLILDTEFGEMYFIKYDMLYMTVDEQLNPKKMLNGFVLVEPETIEVKKEGAQEFIELGSGLVQLAPKHKLKKKKRSINGTVKLSGSLCKGYLQNQGRRDVDLELNNGTKIVYDPRFSEKLEYESHQIMSDKTLHLIQRKDIIGVFGGEKDV